MDDTGAGTGSPPRRRRRAVGPPGSHPATDEPVPERDDSSELKDLDRYLADRPPHHEPR